MFKRLILVPILLWLAVLAPPALAANAPPYVTLINPFNNTGFAPQSNIYLNASASDTDGAVAKVDFYAGTTLLGTKTSAPYDMYWNNVPAGSYQITAVATDNLGQVSV